MASMTAQTTLDLFLAMRSNNGGSHTAATATWQIIQRCQDNVKCGENQARGTKKKATNPFLSSSLNPGL